MPRLGRIGRHQSEFSLTPYFSASQPISGQVSPFGRLGPVSTLRWLNADQLGEIFDIPVGRVCLAATLYESCRRGAEGRIRPWRAGCQRDTCL